MENDYDDEDKVIGDILEKDDNQSRRSKPYDNDSYQQRKKVERPSRASYTRRRDENSSSEGTHEDSYRQNISHNEYSRRPPKNRTKPSIDEGFRSNRNDGNPADDIETLWNDDKANNKGQSTLNTPLERNHIKPLTRRNSYNSVSSPHTMETKLTNGTINYTKWDNKSLHSRKMHRAWNSEKMNRNVDESVIYNTRGVPFRTEVETHEGYKKNEGKFFPDDSVIDNQVDNGQSIRNRNNIQHLKSDHDEIDDNDKENDKQKFEANVTENEESLARSYEHSRFESIVDENKTFNTIHKEKEKEELTYDMNTIRTKETSTQSNNTKFRKKSSLSTGSSESSQSRRMQQLEFSEEKGVNRKDYDNKSSMSQTTSTESNYSTNKGNSGDKTPKFKRKDSNSSSRSTKESHRDNKENIENEKEKEKGIDEIWTKLSVQMASLFLEKKKDDRVAQAAASAVLLAGNKCDKRRLNRKDALHYVAADVSSAILRNGGSQTDASKATIAIIESGKVNDARDSHSQIYSEESDFDKITSLYSSRGDQTSFTSEKESEFSESKLSRTINTRSESKSKNSKGKSRTKRIKKKEQERKNPNGDHSIDKNKLVDHKAEKIEDNEVATLDLDEHIEKAAKTRAKLLKKLKKYKDAEVDQKKKHATLLKRKIAAKNLKMKYEEKLNKLSSKLESLKSESDKRNRDLSEKESKAQQNKKNYLGRKKRSKQDEVKLRKLEVELTQRIAEAEAEKATISEEICALETLIAKKQDNAFEAEMNLNEVQNQIIEKLAMAEAEKVKFAEKMNLIHESLEARRYDDERLLRMMANTEAERTAMADQMLQLEEAEIKLKKNEHDLQKRVARAKTELLIKRMHATTNPSDIQTAKYMNGEERIPRRDLDFIDNTGGILRNHQGWNARNNKNTKGRKNKRSSNKGDEVTLDSEEISEDSTLGSIETIPSQTNVAEPNTVMGTFHKTVQNTFPNVVGGLSQFYKRAACMMPGTSYAVVEKEEDKQKIDVNVEKDPVKREEAAAIEDDIDEDGDEYDGDEYDDDDDVEDDEESMDEESMEYEVEENPRPYGNERNFQVDDYLGKNNPFLSEIDENENSVMNLSYRGQPLYSTDSHMDFVGRHKGKEYLAKEDNLGSNYTPKKSSMLSRADDDLQGLLAEVDDLLEENMEESTVQNSKKSSVKGTRQGGFGGNRGTILRQSNNAPTTINPNRTVSFENPYTSDEPSSDLMNPRYPHPQSDVFDETPTNSSPTQKRFGNIGKKMKFINWKFRKKEKNNS